MKDLLLSIEKLIRWILSLLLSALIAFVIGYIAKYAFKADDFTVGYIMGIVVCWVNEYTDKLFNV